MPKIFTLLKKKESKAKSTTTISSARRKALQKKVVESAKKAVNDYGHVFDNLAQYNQGRTKIIPLRKIRGSKARIS